MKTLVTGSAGYIGSHVVKCLLADGHEVRAMHLPGEDLRNLEGLDVERVAGDVRDMDSVRAAVKGCDWVFHLAALYVLWSPQPSLIRKINVGGTRNMLTAARDAGVERFIHTSSLAVFGGQGMDSDATEESPFALGPFGDVYSQSKYDSHQVALEFAREGVNVVIVAPCAPVGPNDAGPTPTGRLLLSAVNLPVVFVADMISNVVDVRDVARGHVLAAEKGRTGESYLLGNRNTSLDKIARMVFDVTGIRKLVIKPPLPLLIAGARVMLAHAKFVSRKPPLFTPTMVEMSGLGLRADCSKAVRELGLPQTPLKVCVRDALVWFARNGFIWNRAMAEKLVNMA